MIKLRREFMDVVGLITVDELIGNNGVLDAIQDIYERLSDETRGGEQ